LKKIVNSGLHGSTADKEKEFYLFGAQLIEKWSQTYYPAGIIDTNISTMLSRLQPHIPEEVLLLLDQWNRLMMLFSTEQYRLVVGVRNETFWHRFASSSLVLSFVCQQASALVQSHRETQTTNVF